MTPAQTNAHTKQVEAQQPFAAHAPRLSVVVDNHAKTTTANIINTAERPIIIIADSNAATYGQQAETVHKAFQNCAIVFESDRGAAAFYHEAGSMGYYVHHLQIGVLSQHKDKDAETHPALTQADHIVIMGDLYTEYTKEFRALQSQGQNITFSTSPETPVDMDAIIRGRDKPRDYRDFAIRHKVLGGPK